MDNFDIGASGSCSGIYCFKNLIDGKPYVGQGQILKRRKVDHFRYLRNNEDSEYFQIAWNEVRKENFKFFILEECPTELLNERETFWIKELRSHISEWGYNKTWGGQCVRGYKHSPETIQKMKDNVPDRTGENNPFYGKKHTLEAIQKMKDNRSDTSGENHYLFGKHPSPETIEKMIDNHADFSGKNNPSYGKTVSVETRQKQSDSRKGRKHPPEVIQKIKDNHWDNSGENHPNILKKEIVQEIKELLDEHMSGRKIAKKLNVCRPTVSRVKNGWYKDVYGIDGINKKEIKNNEEESYEIIV